MLVILLAHIASCLFLQIAFYEQRSGISSWMDSHHEQSDSFYSKYVTSMYWSIVTMTTIGYGDIIPKTRGKEKTILFVFF